MDGTKNEPAVYYGTLELCAEGTHFVGDGRYKLFVDESKQLTAEGLVGLLTAGLELAEKTYLRTQTLLKYVDIFRYGKTIACVAHNHPHFGWTADHSDRQA